MNDLIFLSHREIDFEKWDKAIDNSPLPFVFAKSFYLNTTTPDWHALVYKDYEAIMPLPIKKKYGITYLYQPPFTPQLGVFGSESEQSVKLFISYISEHFKYIDITLNASNRTSSLNHIKRKTYVIDFTQSHQGRNENTKRNIQKAIKEKVTVETITGKTGVLKNCELYLFPKLTREYNAKKDELIILRRLIENAIDINALTCLLTCNENKAPSAIGLFIHTGRYAVFLKGFSLDKSNGSMHYLMHNAIEYYKEKVFFFDFGGGNDKEGLARFYKGFGSKECVYLQVRKNNLPKFVRWVKEI